jgi:hypothetical protein
MAPLATRQVLIKRDAASMVTPMAHHVAQDARSELKRCEVWSQPRHRDGLASDRHPRPAGWPWEKGDPHVTRMIAAYTKRCDSTQLNGRTV